MKLKFLAIALFPFALAACQSSDIQSLGDTAVKVLQQQGSADKTLTSYQWSNQPVNTDRPIELNFHDKNLNIQTGCNIQNSGWSIENGMISVGNLMTTNMACSSPLMEQEGYTSLLFQNRKVPFVLDTTDINQPTLTLLDPTGKKIVFTGKMTPETKYQTTGETIFLEVSPETKQCTGVSKQTCLQVREIKYAENGVKTQVDKDWSLFYDKIEGFEHTSSERQVIRVKRYEIKNPAADQSKYAYVHDMTIEREAIKGSL